MQNFFLSEALQVFLSSNRTKHDIDNYNNNDTIWNKTFISAELHDDKCIKKSIKDQSMIDLKDNFVTCEHCTKSFSCNKCMSNIIQISRLNRALRMKEQTIQSEYIF